MNLTQLPRVVRRPKKRLGRGHGSGKVKTSGRGTKGQKARGRIPIGFEGGQLPLIKRLPLLRGKSKNKSHARYVYPLKVTKLDSLPDKTEVTVSSLIKYGLIKDALAVKILGSGKLTRAYTVKVACSASATAAIKKAGGIVE